MSGNWEYQTRIEKWSDESVWLAEAGREGWELINVMDWSEGKGKYFLKRPARNDKLPKLLNG